MTTLDDDDLLKLAAVEQILSLSRKTLLTYIKDGKLKATKVNAYWRVRRGDLHKFMGKKGSDDDAVGDRAADAGEVPARLREGDDRGEVDEEAEEGDG